MCGRLVDVALEDVGGGALARSSLRGLSEWVQNAVSQSKPLGALTSLDESQLLAVERIAKNKWTDQDYEHGREVWEKLAREYANCELGEEAMLYQSKGGVVVDILHHADESDYASSSSGTMALFEFR